MDLILTPQEPGTEKFTVVITYENASGDEVVLKYPFEMEVMEAAPVWTPDDGTMDDVQPEQTGFGWIWWLLIAAGAGAGIWFFLKHRKKKKSPDTMNAEDGWAEFDRKDEAADHTDPIILSEEDLKDENGRR